MGLQSALFLSVEGSVKLEQYYCPGSYKVVIQREINILMVEEDPDEVNALKDALTVGQIITVNIEQLEDGEQAMAYLQQEYPYIDAPSPDLIFLNLNLPGMTGAELLQEIKQSRMLADIPVIVLTTSIEQGDLVKNFGPERNCFCFKKPTTCEQSCREG